MIQIKNNTIKVSVRNLVEFILREGNLDNRRSFGSDKDAMQAGSRIHRKIQRGMGSNYRSEVSLKHEFVKDDIKIIIEGRADGIQEDEDGIRIDEIKGVFMNLDFLEYPIFVHQAQAMCYAYIYGIQHELLEIKVQMTYCNIETEVIKQFVESYTLTYLTEWFLDIVEKYAIWAEFCVRERSLRNDSIKLIEFPFAYRKGQKELAVSVYKSINRSKNLFIQAPTGVGKTMSTVFPAVKAMGEGLGEKIFYLTPKTITRTVANESLNLLREQNLYISSIMLTAKDKMCIQEETECNPDVCSRALGHFDRVNDAVLDLIQHEKSVTREILLQYAEKYAVCPFEMGLDVSSFMDVVICDYNYAFDPNVRLKRFFADGVVGDYIFLVDEAHNLVERARSMYSASLYKDSFLSVKKIIGDTSKKLKRHLEKCNKSLLEYEKECEAYDILPNIGGLSLDILALSTELDVYMEEHKDFDQRKEVVSFYLDIRNFLNVHDLLDECYEIFTQCERDGRFSINLFCINPSNNLKECLKKGNSTIFFSATLLPIQYYKELLSGNSEDYAVYIDSPFDTSHRMLGICKDVTSKYTRRNYDEYYKFFQYIDYMIDGRKGNYLMFFPSYQLMEEVYNICNERGLYIKADLIIQEPNMTEVVREEFLLEFSKDRKKSLIGFCVMGGIFSEGIDLKEEKLIGALIVGTGLPQVCNEREILKNYFDKKGQRGFDYSYLYPGMNKVLQAAGRVIRTHDDRGVILLLDDRFLEDQYYNLFPREWVDYQVINRSNVGTALEEFWSKYHWGQSLNESGAVPDGTPKVQNEPKFRDSPQ